MAKAIESTGVTLSVSSGSPTEFLQIGNISAIRGTGAGADVVNITNVEDGAPRKLMGLPDEGSVTVELNYDPDNATHIILRNARRNRTRLEFQIRLTDSTNTLLTFFGFVLAFALDTATGQQVKAALTIEMTGASVDGEVPAPPSAPDWSGTLSLYGAHITLSGGDLIATQDGVGYFASVPSSVTKSSGSWYCTFTINAVGAGVNLGIGSNVSVMADGAVLGANALSYGYLSADGNKRFNGVSAAYGDSFTTGEVIGMRFDADAHTIEFDKNGVSQGVAYTGIGAVPWFVVVNLSTAAVVTANFG